MTGAGCSRFKAKVAVHLILVNGSDEILMLRRFNTGFKDGEYGLVSGHVEAGESLAVAMAREAREEVGITLAPHDLEVVGVTPNLLREYVYFFIGATAWSGSIGNREPDKCDDVSWFSLRELPRNTVWYVRQAIENYLDGNWFSEVHDGSEAAAGSVLRWRVARQRAAD